jgi:hypothetical protein
MDSCQAFYCTNEKGKCEKIFFFIITDQDYPSSNNKTLNARLHQKINIQRYFTIYIIFNDKIAPDQC